MSAPTEHPDFATDTNYTNGPDVGTATKVEPSSGELAEGHIRETAPSPQKMNWWQNLVGKWNRWTAQVLDTIHSATYGNWIPQTSAAAGQLWACGYGNGVFVAVGAGGEIFTSPDGITWTARTAAGAYTDDFRAVVYGESDGRWLIAGDGGEIQTSSDDGATWTARTAAGGFTGTFHAATHDGSRFILVGASGEIQTSPTGTTWTARTADGSYAGDFRAVAFGDGTFVAVGTLGEVQTSTDDGVTWTAQTPAAAYSDTWRGAVWSGENFVIVGAAGEIQSSPEGETWTQQTAADANSASYNFTGITHNGVFTAVSGAGRIETSKDGVTWKLRPTETASSFNGVASSDDLVVAVSTNASGLGIFTNLGPGILANSVSLLDGRVDTIEERLEAVTTTNDGAYVANLSNISSVSNFRLQALRYDRLWSGSFAIDVDVSLAAVCSFRMQIPTADGIAATSHVSGSGAAGLDAVASVTGAGTEQILVSFSASGTGVVTVRGAFTYYQTP